ncbi:hypothetical protein CB1_000950004 [Camelus ferus]|nr:hypothetical protein CB1_000950004 [Camelus ferus]
MCTNDPLCERSSPRRHCFVFSVPGMSNQMGQREWRDSEALTREGHRIRGKAPGSFRAHNSPSTAPPCDPHSEHGWIQTQGTTELHPDPSHPWHMGLLGTGRLSGSSDLAQHRPPGCRW